MDQIEISSFHVGGEVIQSKAAMTRKCQEIMDLAPWGPRAFRSAMLIDLVAKYHYFCSANNLPPDRFRKDPPLPGYLGYNLMGHFPGLEGDGWHGVAWTKCITLPSFTTEAIAGFRALALPVMQNHRKNQCEKCDDSGPRQIDHSDPTFAEIMDQIMPLFSQEDRRTWCGFNWIDHERFEPPADHPATIRFWELHNTSTLTTLCLTCHQNVTEERRERN